MPCLRPYLLATALLLGADAHAQAPTWGGAVTLASDYVFRGLSYTKGHPAAQLDLHLRDKRGAFAGVWLSNSSRAVEVAGHTELDLYGGFSGALSERTDLMLRVVHYGYPQARIGRRYDDDEVALVLTLDDRLSMTVAASPNAALFGRDGQLRRGRRLVGELAGQWPIATGWSLSGSAGHYDLSSPEGGAYAAWQLGLQAEHGGWLASLGRFGTSAGARRLFGDNVADGHWVATLTRRF